MRGCVVRLLLCVVWLASWRACGTCVVCIIACVLSLYLMLHRAVILLLLCAAPADTLILLSSVICIS